MAAWAVTLGILIYDDNYQFFLAPKFEFLIVAGLVLSLIFAISLASTDINKDGDHIIKGLTLILPILFICSAGDSTLGNFALSKRTIKPLETTASDMQASGPSASAKSPEVADHDIPLVSISNLIRKWENYDGRRIQVEGLFANTVSGNESLSAVFRYFITCCAADAMPVGVFMVGQGDAGIKDNDWVIAGGRVQHRKIDGYDVIFMEVEGLEKKKKPSKNAAYIF
ncbi:MAG: hypothetical protein HUN04_18135 [Desulfobacter sp.]|nr:MAG: hypothetical protein HUN04_18135 [Desulfobacter sp.]